MTDSKLGPDDSTSAPNLTGGVPKEGWWDRAHALAKGMIGAIPGVGGVAAELFGMIVTPPIARRRDAWMSEVGNVIAELHAKRGVNLESLSSDEEFIDIVARATTAAMKTRIAEKRTALKNAIVNTALKTSGSAIERALFVEMTDSFTELHLHLLDLFEEPQRWFSSRGQPAPQLYAGGLINVVFEAFPTLRGHDDLIELVWTELSTRGLHRSGGMRVTMMGDGLMQGRLSEFGRRYLAFVRSPPS